MKKLCACGCGKDTQSTYARGHNNIGKSKSPEHRENLSKARQGLRVSEEGRLSISKAQKKRFSRAEEREKASQRQSNRDYSKELRELICYSCGRSFMGKTSRTRFCSTECYEPHAVKKQYERHLVNKYGISYQEYEELYNKQNSCCGICGESIPDKKLCVDHNHKTGEVRGLLCFTCNVGLGNFKDSSDIIMKAYNYLCQ